MGCFIFISVYRPKSFKKASERAEKGNLSLFTSSLLSTMRVLIAFCTLFSLVLAITVKRTQNHDCPSEEPSGYGYPSPTGSLASPSPTSSPATSTTSGLIPGSSPNPDDSDPSYSCHSGSVQCCNNLYSYDHPEARDLVGRMDMNFARQLPSFGSFGFDCSPVVLGGGSGSVQW